MAQKKLASEEVHPLTRYHNCYERLDIAAILLKNIITLIYYYHYYY